MTETLSKTWTREQESFLKENFHLGYKFLQSQLGKSYLSLKCKISRLRNTTTNTQRTSWTDDEEAILRENYPLFGLKKCVELLPNKNYEKIQSKANLMNLRVLNSVKSRLYREDNPFIIKKTKVDLDKFLNIQDKEIAYFLGFFWADGFLCKKGVALECAEEDVLELEPTFNTFGVWTERVRHRDIHTMNMKTLSIYRLDFKEWLASHGYKAKSHESADTILSIIPDELKHYWFRGLFDGDGYFCYRPKEGTYSTQIASSRFQDWTYMKLLCQQLNIKYVTFTNSFMNDKTQEINGHSKFHIFGKEKSAIFLNYIYKDRKNDNIGLSRKYNIWKEFLSQIEYEKINKPAHRKIIELN